MLANEEPNSEKSWSCGKVVLANVLAKETEDGAEGALDDDNAMS